MNPDRGPLKERLWTVSFCSNDLRTILIFQKAPPKLMERSSLWYAMRTVQPNPEHWFPRSDKSHPDQCCYSASKTFRFPGPVPDVLEVVPGTFILASTGKHQAHQSLRTTFPHSSLHCYVPSATGTLWSFCQPDKETMNGTPDSWISIACPEPFPAPITIMKSSSGIFAEWLHAQLPLQILSSMKTSTMFYLPSTSYT